MRPAPPPVTTTGPSTIGCATESACLAETTSDAMAHLTKVYIAGLLILGLFGNVYCVTAFLMPVFRRVPSTLFLAALALSDIGFLMTLGLMWMRSIGLRFLDLEHVCKTCMFMSYFCCFVSSWLVFAITMERFLLASGDRFCTKSIFRCTLKTKNLRQNIVGKPISTPTNTKHRRVRITFAAIIIFGLFINSWVLFTADSVIAMPKLSENRTSSSTTPKPGPAICDVNQAAAGRWYAYFNALDMIFSFTLPFLGVLILNAKIGFRVCKAQSLARRQGESRAGTSTGGGNGEGDSIIALRRPSRSAVGSALVPNLIHVASTTGGDLDRFLNEAELVGGDSLDGHRASFGRLQNRYRRQRRDKIERRVTQLLVTVSLAYLILNLPSYVHRVVFAFESSVDSGDEKGFGDKTPLEIVAETVSYLMFYTQFSINFFLYSCHGCMFGFNC